MPSDQYHQRREDEKVTRQELRAEQRDFFQTQEQRRKVFPRAILVGLLARALAVGVSRRGHRPKRLGGLGASIPGLGLAAAHPLWRGGGWPRRLPGEQPGSGDRRQRDSPPEGRIVPAALTTLATHPPRQVLRWGVRDREWASTGTGGPYRADGRCGRGCRGGMAQGDAARTPNINCRGSRGGIGSGVQCPVSGLS